MVGRLAVLPLLALFVMGSFAGCLGDGKGGGASVDEGDDGGEPAGDPVFSQTTGAITGYVLDVAYAPIVGATVSLTKDDVAPVNVTTDDTGAYTISEIAPGAYLLYANMTGYRPRSKPVTITEGTLVREQFLLEEAPSITPFIDGPIEFNGYIECSTAPPNGKCVQSGAQGVGNQRSSGNYLFKDGIQAILFEMIWDTGQGIGANDNCLAAGSGGMSLTASWDSNDGDGAASAKACSGEDPKIYLERRLNDAGEWKISCVEGCSEARDEINDWPLDAGGALAFGGQPNAVNVVAQRDFKIYISAFYYQMMPPGYTGVPEQ